MFDEDAKTRQEIKKLQKMMKKSPLLFARLGECYLRLGDWDAAEKILAKGVETHPDYIPGLLLLGEGYLYSGFPRDAEDCALRGLELHPNHLGLLRLLERIKNNTEEEAELAKVRKNLSQLDPLYDGAGFGRAEQPEALEEESSSEIDEIIAEDSAFEIPEEYRVSEELLDTPDIDAELEPPAAEADEKMELAVEEVDALEEPELAEAEPATEEAILPELPVDEEIEPPPVDEDILPSEAAFRELDAAQSAGEKLPELDEEETSELEPLAEPTAEEEVAEEPLTDLEEPVEVAEETLEEAAPEEEPTAEVVEETAEELPEMKEPADDLEPPAAETEDAEIAAIKEQIADETDVDVFGLTDDEVEPPATVEKETEVTAETEELPEVLEESEVAEQEDIPVAATESQPVSAEKAEEEDPFGIDGFDEIKAFEKSLDETLNNMGPPPSVEEEPVLEEGSAEPVAETAAEEIAEEAPKPGPKPKKKIATKTLGELYATQKKYEEAIEIYTKLIESDPSNQQYQDRLEELQQLKESALSENIGTDGE